MCGVADCAGWIRSMLPWLYACVLCYQVLSGSGADVDCVLLLVLLQIEGGFVQGMGWLCLEEMIWGDKV